MAKKQISKLFAVFALSCAIMAASFVIKKNRSKIEWNGEVYDIQNVNALDACLAHPYNKSLDRLADCILASVIFCAALPSILVFAFSDDKKKAFSAAFFEALAFVTSFFCNNGVYRILKAFAGRIRPYMYFPNPSQSGIASHDFYRSWPSGHSSTVFFAFAFLLFWFCLWHPDSKFKKPLLSLELFLCVLTMVLRLLSGNHFLTDVLSGASIGFAISSAAIFACNRIKNDAR